MLTPGPAYSLPGPKAVLICSNLRSGSGCGAVNRKGANFCTSCGQPLRYALELHDPGDVVGVYTISGLIGHGGFGAVYQAEHAAQPGAPIALKETFDPASMRSLQHEFAVLRGLHHPNIPRYHEWFEHQGNGYLVMEYIPGQNLEAILGHSGALAAPQVLSFAVQLCDVVGYLHTRPTPILHRDIKPANIRLTPDGLIKLVDFGLLKQGGQLTRQTISGAATLAYAPLEQYGGGGLHTDQRSDLYSLGSTLYHLLTGHEPPSAGTRVAMASDPLAPAHQLNPALAPGLSAALARAMALRQQDRFPDAASLKAALLGLPAYQPGGSPPPAPMGPQPATGPTLRAAGPRPATGLTLRASDQVLPPHKRLDLAAHALGGQQFGTALDQLRAVLRASPRNAQAVALLLDIVQSPRAAREQRLLAGALLGEAGDPRLPVSYEEWQRSLNFGSKGLGHMEDYWCRVPRGTYQVGGWDDRRIAAFALPEFWIARYPLTVAQYARFAMSGYDEGARQHWTRAGWSWRVSTGRTDPYYWAQAPYASLNQPVIGVCWYEAVAFCNWLNDLLESILPAGYCVCLPTEAEWEAAATADPSGRPRAYPWGWAAPAPDLASYGSGLPRHPAPVGCFPAGAAVCGALDMAGNVWELAASSWRAYPDEANALASDRSINDEEVVWRGGSWSSEQGQLRCGARIRSMPRFTDLNRGFRLFLAPESH